MPIPNSENKSLSFPFLLVLSAVSGIVAYFLISIISINFVIPLSFGIFIFLFNLILLLLLTNNGNGRTFTLRTSLVSKDLFYITLGVIASVCIAIPNATVQLNATLPLFSYFSSLAPLSYLRIVSAFFITGFFPGITVYFVFFKNYDFNVVEKLGLIILISYCFTMISGLLLGYFQVFSTVTYVLAFWIFAAVMLGYKQIKIRNKAELPFKSTSFALDINLIALAFAAISLVILSYISVLASAPMSGIVGGDVLDYMVSATRFAWSDFAGWSPYVWSNNFYWLISNLSGLPMYFVYVGLQFYLIIPAAAFYFLVRTVFSGYKKIAAIATLVFFFAAGVTSWAIFSASALDGKDILATLFQYTGSPGITPFALSPLVFDFGFLFFALAFVYRGVFKKERKLINYILPAIFIAAAFFSHNFNIIFIFIFSLIFLGLFLTECRWYIFKLSLLTLVSVLAFDPLSKWMFISTVFAAAVRLDAVMLVTPVAIGIAGLFLLFYFKKRNLHLRPKWSSNLVEKTKVTFSNNKTKLLFYIGGFLFFGVAVSLYLLNYNQFTYTSSWTILDSKDFHLDWIVFRSFGIILPFALASIPFMVRHERNSLLFTSVISLAIFVSTVVTISFPGIIPPYIGYVRYVGYLVIPLSILAAFGIFYSLQHLKKRYFKALFIIILVVLVSTSILSQAFGRERLLDLGKTPITLSTPDALLADDKTPLLSNNTALAVDWMNVNLTKGATVLPLSNDSEKILSNFVLDIKVTPDFQIWHLKDVLLNSSTEIVLYCLNTLGINYVFVDQRNNIDNSLNQIVQSLPIVYSNNETIIYKTRPSTFNDSNSMPYLDSLFQKITYNFYQQYTGSTPMNNKVIWFSNITAAGDMNVSSNMIGINENKLFVSSMFVSSNNGNVAYESKALSNVSIKGAGDIIVGSMPSVQLNNAKINATGTSTLIDFSESQNVSLSLRNADINFKIGSSNMSFRNANITIILGTSNPLVTCKQPIVAVNGSLTGAALGLVQGTTFYQNSVTTLTRAGLNPLIIEFPLTDNLLYSQVANAKVEST